MSQHPPSHRPSLPQHALDALAERLEEEVEAFYAKMEGREWPKSESIAKAPRPETEVDLSNSLFPPDFISSIASSVEELDPAQLFWSDGDINFERDFGQWFVGDDHEPEPVQSPLMTTTVARESAPIRRNDDFERDFGQWFCDEDLPAQPPSIPTTTAVQCNPIKTKDQIHGISERDIDLWSVGNDLLVQSTTMSTTAPVESDPVSTLFTPHFFQRLTQSLNELNATMAGLPQTSDNPPKSTQVCCVGKL